MFIGRLTGVVGHDSTQGLVLSASFLSPLKGDDRPSFTLLELKYGLSLGGRAEDRVCLGDGVTSGNGAAQERGVRSILPFVVVGNG